MAHHELTACSSGLASEWVSRSFNTQNGIAGNCCQEASTSRAALSKERDSQALGILQGPSAANRDCSALSNRGCSAMTSISVRFIQLLAPWVRQAWLASCSGLTIHISPSQTRGLGFRSSWAHVVPPELLPAPSALLPGEETDRPQPSLPSQGSTASRPMRFLLLKVHFSSCLSSVSCTPFKSQ